MAKNESLVESLSGVSVGVNAVVAAISFEFGLSVGLPVASAGPLCEVDHHGHLAERLLDRHRPVQQTTFTATLNAGVGINIFAPATSIIKKLFGYDIPAEKELLTNDVLKMSSYLPKVAVCKP